MSKDFQKKISEMDAPSSPEVAYWMGRIVAARIMIEKAEKADCFELALEALKDFDACEQHLKAAREKENKARKWWRMAAQEMKKRKQ